MNSRRLVNIHEGAGWGRGQKKCIFFGYVWKFLWIFYGIPSKLDIFNGSFLKSTSGTCVRSVMKVTLIYTTIVIKQDGQGT